ncbi:hypothetical protein HanXRQr2_Chr06g0239901 [Helianthus annuus]|uniref:Uncharacterized protein n=1 Tax=Helianthus annuus TaxID=4232 RepID=A0A9K3NHN8_HELAN|nr:hypothetical protein HanXRQr2_Chr06g0239901 [Helianthus annuus]
MKISWYVRYFTCIFNKNLQSSYFIAIFNRYLYLKKKTEIPLFRVNYCFCPCGLSKITISVH